MQKYHQYSQWVERVLEDNDEFGYRYIYDAYLLAQNPRAFGFYYVCNRRTSPDGSTEYVLQARHGAYVLILGSDQNRIEFMNYLITRFCPDTRDMEAWHTRRSDWHDDEIDNWVGANGKPL